MPSRFAGKVVIVTGSSSGIGRATAVLFAKEGAKVTITGRNAERLEETKRLILCSKCAVTKRSKSAERSKKNESKSVAESNVNSVVADVTTDAGQTEIIDSTIAKFGKLDILVNNAGASLPDPEGKKGISQSIETFDGTFSLNVRCVVQLVQKARPHLAATRGEIVNVSSMAALPLAQPVYTYYAMAKAALDQLTRSTAIELIEYGIRVNSVSPGPVVSGFAEAMGLTGEGSKQFYKNLQGNKNCIPAGQPGAPEDIANIIAFLADRSVSSYIIGQSIVADGGATLMLAMRAHLVNITKKD